MAEWFEVSKAGLKALQDGKSKTFIIRELIQNAWDENVKNIVIDANYYRNLAKFSITDDSPIGFRDITDAYTLFAPCYKRPDPEKRGRFNAGEKQVFAVCKNAMIETTTGTIIFDEKGRHRKKDKRASGSKVTIDVAMTTDEYWEVMEYIQLLIPPKNIVTIVNGSILKSKKPHKTFNTTLTTEYLKDDKFVRTNRKTDIELYQKDETKGQAYLYEMGIPVCNIECEYSVNVNQRIPMGIDRDTVSQSYLKDLFAEILNNAHDSITNDNASDTWIRIGMSDERVSKDAVSKVIHERYGDKPLVATVGDSLSIDDAKANGHRIIYGSEMSKDEWDNIRKFGILPSTSDKYGRGTCDWSNADKTKAMCVVEKLAKKIAKHILDIDIKVRFIEAESKNTPSATFGLDGLTFYVSNLGESFFHKPLDHKVLDLIIHELGHYGGNHTEIGYHKTLTKIGAGLTLTALNDPSFFAEFEGVWKE